MPNIFLRQELTDPQMAGVYDRCPCCGTEFYSRREAEEYDGLCEECWCAMYDEEADDGTA